MTRVAVPFHLHEPRTPLDLPVDPDLVVDAPVPESPTWPALGPLYQRVTACLVEAARDLGPPPVIFTADCCATSAVLAGLHRLDIDPTLVWIDAHGDFNTPETTISGYLGGMALSFLTGRGDADSLAGSAFTPMADESVLLVDGRDLDPAEEQLLTTTGVRRTPLSDLDRALRAIREDEPIYLHIDLDVLDPSELPGLLFPAAGGPDLDELVAAVREVAGRGRLAAASIGCTWHPDETDAERCREVVAALLEAIEGEPE
jgi:arginase